MKREIACDLTTKSVKLPRFKRTILMTLSGCLLSLMILNQTLFADTIGVEIISLTSHFSDQRDAPVDRYKYKLEDSGTHLLTPGVELNWDHRLEKPFLSAEELRVAGGYYLDSIAFPAAYFGVGLRWVIYESNKFSGSIQLGPGIILRKSWTSVEDYNPDNPYDESDWFLKGFEFKIMPVGDLDFHYRFSDDLQAVWSIVPAFPFVFVQNFGIRWAY
ncbi:MAG: hypothetical protein OEY59_10590 [Deltaproteobacteria bacterium]|nr:hypothetical protein [Deltaproteobacteria bacterium]